jgi:SAM-dependent methyltransferase
MGSEYDDIQDLWYGHLFNRIHGFILELLPRTWEDRAYRALDVGCGTGFQSALLMRCGFEVRAFDVSTGLLAECRTKLTQAPALKQLYTARLPSQQAEHRAQLRLADRIRGDRPIGSVSVNEGDAESAASYEPGGFDVVNCSGSVLSFLDEPETALGLISQALVPGGLAFIELEQKLNLDLYWPVLDVLLGGRIGYEQRARQAIANVFAWPGENLRISYPFELHDDAHVDLPITLFSVGYLADAFERHSLEVVSRMGIHAVTNLIPSPVLHDPKPTLAAVSMFRWLSAIEKPLARLWPFWRLGCSAIYCLRRS